MGPIQRLNEFSKRITQGQTQRHMEKSDISPHDGFSPQVPPVVPVTNIRDVQNMYLLGLIFYISDSLRLASVRG